MRKKSPATELNFGPPPVTGRMRKKALSRLILATLFWGLSFPLLKTVGALQQQKLGEISSWFATGAGTALRFGGAGLLLFLSSPKCLARISRLEIWQGLGLGFFGGLGLLFQVDGMAYTSASISAFLTQAYCLFLPLIVAVRDRQLPTQGVWVSCLLSLAGVGILADVNWRHLKIGRGEFETLIASVIFAGQILWLERPIFKKNNVTNFSLIMFATIAGICALVGALAMRAPSDLSLVFADPKIEALTLVLVVFCTLGAYMLMNHWQAFIPATEAALAYGMEPVFASLFALFLPGMLSAWTGLDYPNETITRNLVIGGGLILLANVIIQLTHKDEKAA